VIVTLAEEVPGSTSKIVAVVEHVLYNEHIKHLTKSGLWPATFRKTEEGEKETSDKKSSERENEQRDSNTAEEQEDEGESESDSEEERELFHNPNHQCIEDIESDEDEQSEDE